MSPVYLCGRSAAQSSPVFQRVFGPLCPQVSGLAVFIVLAVARYVPAAQAQTVHFGGLVLTLSSGFNFPYSVAVDASGNVFVADTFNNAVQEILAVGGSIPASRTILTLGNC